MFVGSTSGNKFAGVLPKNGAYEDPRLSDAERPGAG